MKGAHRSHRHVHVKCGFCDWEKCPGEHHTLAMSGFYLIHVIDEHWDLVERIRATTGDKDARTALIQQIDAELL